MGEPVISTRFKYKIETGLSFVSVPTFNTRLFRKVLLSSLPAEAQLKPRLYNVKIRYRLASSLQYMDVFLVSDVGIPGIGDGETWSYNVPGSPDWGKLFYKTELMKEYVSAKDAKMLMTSPMSIVEAKIIRHEVTQYDLHEWYKIHDKSEQIDALLNANKHLADGIRRSTGHRAKYMSASDVDVMAGKSWVGRGAQSALDRLQKEFDKLSNVPGRFISDANPEPYRVAVRDAKQMVGVVESEIAKFKVSGVDPASLPQGSEPAFWGAYEVENLVEGLGYNYFGLKQKGSSEYIRIYHQRDYVLYKGIGLIQVKEEYCQSGLASFDVLDPLSLTEDSVGLTEDPEGAVTISQFVVPCDKERAIIRNIPYNIHGRLTWFEEGQSLLTTFSVSDDYCTASMIRLTLNKDFEIVDREEQDGRKDC